MAINYTTLFQRIGRLVDKANDYLTFQGTTLMGVNEGVDDILDEYDTRRDLVVGLQESYEGFARTVQSWISRLLVVVNETLADLQVELNAPNSTPAVILPLLKEDMIANAQTILKNTASVGAVTVGGTNVGDVTLLVSAVGLDGVTDERIIAETVEVRCTSDRFTGASAGSEVFSVVGFPKFNPNDGVPARGNGTTSMVVSNSRTRLVNGGFENWSVANTPDNWSIDAGTVGTHILQETVNKKVGSSSLELAQSGATTTATVSQTQAGTILKPSTRYCAYVWLRRDTTSAGASNLAVRLIGTGAPTINIFNANPTTLTTSFVLFSVFFTTPANIPTDYRVEITWTSLNLATGMQVYVDEAVVAEPVDFGHVRLILARGATDPIKNDLYNYTSADDYAGKFQTFFGRFYDTMLPSAASPTISDSLAA